MSASSASAGIVSAEPVSAVDLLFPDFAAEHAATRRLLARVPEGKGDWRPHEWSTPLYQLATHVADIPNRGVSILTTDEMDATTRVARAPLTTAAELLAAHDSSVAALDAALAGASLADLEREWQIRRGDQIVIRGKRRELLRTVMMSHLIHHRAQLGVYLRLLGVPIPGMYGPSADDIAGRAKP
ncbi:MAG TPA: DinB family protein [Gemmatimonadaceae bacterium]